MSARERLDEWAALAEAATEGPWFIADGDSWVHAPSLAAQDEATEVADVFDFGADGRFIAASRTALPAAVKALRDVLDLAEKYTETDETRDREWGDVPGWRLRQAIESAIGGAE